MESKEIKFDHLRRPILTEKGAIDLLLEGKKIPNQSLVVEDEELYRNGYKLLYGTEPADIFYRKCDVDSTDFHEAAAKQWSMPASYKTINVLEYLLAKCQTEKQEERVCQEYIAFEDRELIDVLRFLIFLVDHMREHKYVWGVGRGSSVSSYILFLIGVHRIDPLKYNLSIDEFLK